MNFKGGDFSTGEMGNFHPALTIVAKRTQLTTVTSVTCARASERHEEMSGFGKSPVGPNLSGVSTGTQIWIFYSK